MRKLECVTSHSQTFTELVAKYDYTLRADGKREQVLETDDQGNDTTIDWVYDDLGRLTEERYNSELGNGTEYDYITRYGYDLASNRVRLEKDNGNADAANFTSDETTIYTHDANDRLLTETTTGTKYTTITYEYGGPGNPGTKQTLKTVTGDDEETHVFNYDARGRLAETSVTKDGSTTVSTYKYNDQGVRVEQAVRVNGGAEVVTVYHIDPQNHTGYAKAIEEIVDGILKRSYTIGHEIISQADDAGTANFFLHDGHGSTRALLSELAGVVEQYAYDAFGTTLAGTGLTLAENAATTWLFAGDGQFDPTNGLTNHIARWRQGHRFLSLDPIGGNIQDPLSLHKYLYAHGDAISFTDPSGESIVSMSASIATASIVANISLTVVSGVRHDLSTNAIAFNIGQVRKGVRTH